MPEEIPEKCSPQTWLHATTCLTLLTILKTILEKKKKQIRKTATIFIVLDVLRRSPFLTPMVINLWERYCTHPTDEEIGKVKQVHIPETESISPLTPALSSYCPHAMKDKNKLLKTIPRWDRFMHRAVMSAEHQRNRSHFRNNLNYMLNKTYPHNERMRPSETVSAVLLTQSG